MTAELEFLDCNCFIGRPQNAIPQSAPTADDLLAAMGRSGIGEALVWHVAQRDWSPVDGNRMVAEAIAPHPALGGCWTLLPEQTGELPAPAELPALMAKSRIRALRAFPTQHRFLLRSETVGGYLEVMGQRRIPLVLSLEGGTGGWPMVYDLLRDFPKLVCILADVGLWGADRWFRPLVARYPGVYVEMADYCLDGGIEAFVGRYGAERLIYGSGFPFRSHGGMMLALRHAPIRDEDKAAIAAGNARRILTWA